MPDPIETARQELKAQQRAEAAADDATQRPTVHPMRAFTGSDGETYRRRGDIRMSEWKAYTDDPPVMVAEEKFWVGLFMGAISADTLAQAREERIAHAEAALADWTTDVYFAVRDTLFDSILRPASPKAEAGSASDESTAP